MARRIERALADGDAVQAQLEAVELARRELEALLEQMRREFARSEPRDAARAQRRTKH